jgi:antitoxin ParD1/3/4
LVKNNKRSEIHFFLSSGAVYLQPIKNNGLNRISKLGIFMENIAMGKNTSMLLGDHFEQFIQQQVDSGRFSSASEVVRTALRMMEAEEVQNKALNKALARGERSGFFSDFDPKAHLKKLKQKTS